MTTIPIEVPGHNYKSCGCIHCRERSKLATLADAVKSLDMTDKQIRAACRPKLKYYSSMTKTSQRSCLWCGWKTERERYQQNGPYIPEPTLQLENHYMKSHAVKPTR